MASQTRDFQHLLQSLIDETEGDVVSVSEILSVVGVRSFGPLILLLGFISVSPLTIIPGGTWAVALVTLLITIQIVLGFKRPVLPGRLLGLEFKRDYLVQGVEASRKWAATLDKLVSPRLTILTSGIVVRLVALICVIAALITFPLGFIPFGPVLPGLSILLFGLGLAARDGVMILLALAAVAGGGIVMSRLFF